jgi:hypothetical protein
MVQVKTKKSHNCPDCDYKTASEPMMNKHKKAVHSPKITVKPKLQKEEKEDKEMEVVVEDEREKKIKELKESLSEALERVTELEQIVTANGQVIETMEEEKHHMEETIETMVNSQQRQEELLFTRLQYSAVCSNCSLVLKPGPDLVNHKCGEHSGTVPPKEVKIVDSEDGKEETEKPEQEPMEETKEAGKSKNKEILEGKNWDCDQCDYQGSSESTLRNHMQKKHEYECFACLEGFNSFSELMVHRKATHKVKVCRFRTNCKFGDRCYYKHPDAKETQQEEEDWECKDCGNGFKTKKEMMIHRKTTHSTQVCRYYLNGDCTKGEECWYQHKPASQRLPNRQKDFPSLPTTGKSPAVGNMTMQQTLLKMMQEHQTNMTKLMTMM